MTPHRFLLASILAMTFAARVGAWAENAPLDSLRLVESRLQALGKGGAPLQDYLNLGDAYLRAGESKRAEGAYKKALEIDKASLEAKYGVAQVYYREAAKRGIRAVMLQRRAFGSARQLAETAPQFAPASLLFGLCYEWLKRDYDRAIFYYERYVKMRPDDPEGYLALGRACIESKKFKRIEEVVLPFADAHPNEYRLLPIVGQYRLVHGRGLEASEDFGRYVRSLGAAEQDLYQDIRLVASKAEMAEYQALPDSARAPFLGRFWARRDADILTGVNEGLMEHYRRVWYALNYFSAAVKPWDRRGEVYIRYGEPDNRARSGSPGIYQSPAVQSVKERMAHLLYGANATEEIYVGTVYPIRSTKTADAIMGPATPAPALPTSAPLFSGDAQDPTQLPTEAQTSLEATDIAQGADASLSMDSVGYRPVTLQNDQSLVGWESWVYTGIDGGIEITFTDEMGNGVYDYAPIPTMNSAELKEERALSRMARFTEFAPRAVLEKAAVSRPDEYRLTREGPSLGFYYATADFRGEGDQTRVEIAYGLPTKELTSYAGGDTMGVAVQRTVALASRENAEVYRANDETVLQSRGIVKKTRGEIIPDLVRLNVPPGDYQLAIQITDKVSGRAGMYKQDLKVKPYSRDRLQVSDILLAYAIVDSLANPQFRKGSIWVLPMPSRTYGEGQSAAAYYEVYNLQKDSRGHTRYKVEYSVRSEVSEGYGLLGKTASRFQKIFSGNKPQVAVGYERAGAESSDVGYLTLDLKRLKPGMNRLKVTVTDMVTQDTAEQETMFRYIAKGD